VSYDEFSKSIVNYVNTELEGGSDIIPVIEEFDDIRVTWEIENMPNDLTPTEEASAVKKRLQQMKVNAFFYRLLTITQNMEKLWGLAWGNTSASLKSQIETDLDFNQCSKSLDSIWLLQKLKKEVAGIDELANRHVTLIQGIKNMINIRQQPKETCDAYYKRFESMI
jgi:hypothetical protein